MESTSLPTTAPVYARALEVRALRAEAQVASFEQSLTELRVYLTSPKFTSQACLQVNPQDVLLRLSEMRSGMLEAEARVR